MKRAEARERMRQAHVRRALEKQAMDRSMVSALMPLVKITQPTKMIPVAAYVPKNTPGYSKSTKPFRVRPDPQCIRNKHVYEKVDERFQRCKDCHVLICFNPPKPKLKSFPKFLFDRRFPPTHPSGRYCSDIYISPIFRIRRDYFGNLSFTDFMVDSHLYRFSVKFPKGWCLTQGFTDMQWHKIIEAVEPLLATNDPVAIFNEAQRAIYGRAWSAIYKHLL